jgi:hypothetical protein
MYILACIEVEFFNKYSLPALSHDTSTIYQNNNKKGGNANVEK